MTNFVDSSFVILNRQLSRWPRDTRLADSRKETFAVVLLFMLVQTGYNRDVFNAPGLDFYDLDSANYR